MVIIKTSIPVAFMLFAVAAWKNIIPWIAAATTVKLYFDKSFFPVTVLKNLFDYYRLPRKISALFTCIFQPHQAGKTVVNSIPSLLFATWMNGVLMNESFNFLPGEIKMRNCGNRKFPSQI